MELRSSQESSAGSDDSAHSQLISKENTNDESRSAFHSPFSLRVARQSLSTRRIAIYPNGQSCGFIWRGSFFIEFKTAVFRGLASGVGPPSANFGPTVNAALRITLLTLADGNNLPLVWAASNGAARTGWAAAVVQMALGVTEEEVIEDYLLTNQFRSVINDAQFNALVGSGRLGKAVYLEPQLFDRAEYLQAAFDEMRRIYGTEERASCQ